jgi:hypothetical protein
MRNFAYKNPDFVKDDYVPELVEENPCYQESVYDSVMYDETPEGDLIQVDMRIIRRTILWVCYLLLNMVR